MIEIPTLPVQAEIVPPESTQFLARQLLRLSLPVLAENVLHIFVGVTDVYLAGHLRSRAEAATAALGAVAYVVWLVGMLGGAIGAGSTAIIARAVGARHRSLANSVCAQSVGAAALTGVLIASLFALSADPLSRITGLNGEAREFARFYFQVLSLCLPFFLTTVAASACLRGAGDTLSPAIALIAVDVVNIAVSATLTHGWLGFPNLGFRGIAIGTVAAYIVGGFILIVILLRGGRIRLRVHRLRPHWLTLKRILRIGLPSAMEIFGWLAQFAIVIIINRIDPTNISAAAHIVTIRVESFSYMGGLAVATAAATVVGQSLGARDPERAKRSTYVACAIGAAYMICWGFAFALFGRQLAGFMTSEPRAAALSAQCLFVTAFAQPGFAANLIFGGALRGAGDTLSTMLINLGSQIGLRLLSVLILTLYFGEGLIAIWIVLASELTIRGMLMYGRFLHGGWRHVRV